jgi:hypothetical protein
MIEQATLALPSEALLASLFLIKSHALLSIALAAVYKRTECMASCAMQLLDRLLAASLKHQWHLGARLTEAS